MHPIIYDVASIGNGRLSVMAMPAADDQIDGEFIGLSQLGIDHVVSLLDVNEQIEVGLEEEKGLCLKNGMRYTAFPITDREVPPKADALAFVDTLYSDISNGEHVVIHCRAGIGRIGMIAGAILIQAGYSPGEAVHMVSFARGALVPDTEDQVNWIKSLGRLAG